MPQPYPVQQAMQVLNGMEQVSIQLVWASNLIHEYSADGTTLIREFSIPGVTGLRDLAYDGQYFYGGAAANTIYQMDFTTNTLIGTIPSTQAVRHIAYDSDLDAFWVGNWSTPIVCIDRSGTQLHSIPADPVVTSNYGSAYDNVSAGGPYLWVWSQGGGAGAPQFIHQVHLPDGVVTGVSHDVLTDVGLGGALSIAGGLFSMTDFATGFFTIGGLLQGNPIGDQLFVYEVEATGSSTITIAEAIEDLNMDFVPDRLGQTVTVEGVVFSPNYQTTNNSFYISDGTAGTDIFMYGPPLFTWAMGDMLQITGEVDQYNGMTEIIPADSSGWVFMSSGNPTPNPIVLTLAQYKANSEMYEGSLVGFVSLTLVGGTWPATGSSANLYLAMELILLHSELIPILIFLVNQNQPGHEILLVLEVNLIPVHLQMVDIRYFQDSMQLIFYHRELFLLS